MKTPLSYYGGKQTLAPEIIPLLPPHTCYVEPFCGGAAVFFTKKPSAMETLNDTNGELINFYRIVQQDFVSLEKQIQITLYSRMAHHDAQVTYNNPHRFSPLERAWRCGCSHINPIVVSWVPPLDTIGRGKRLAQ